MTNTRVTFKLEIDHQTWIACDFYSWLSHPCIARGQVISFFHAGIKYEIMNDQINFEGIDRLNSFLKKLLRHELVLHKSIKADVGYLWQEYLQEKTAEHFFLEMEGENGIPEWIGLQYYLWENVDTKVTMWLFEKDGKAYLELTPGYRWHFADPKVDEFFISYEEFIKNYKPYLILEIPWERVAELEEETSKLIKLMGLDKMPGKISTC